MGGRAYRGVRLRPGRAGQLLRIDLSELAGRVVDAGDVLGGRRLASCSADRWTEGLLALLARPHDPHRDSVVAEAVSLVGGEPRLRLPDLARRLAIGERQLRRRFERSVGLPPSSYARVAGWTAPSGAPVALTGPGEWSRTRQGSRIRPT